MKLFEHEKVGGGRHIAVFGALSLTWVNELWVLRVFGTAVCGVKCRHGRSKGHAMNNADQKLDAVLRADLSAAIRAALRVAAESEREACAKIAKLFEAKADALNDCIADDEDRERGRSEYAMGQAFAARQIACAIRNRLYQPRKEQQ